MAENSRTVPDISKTAFCCPHCGAYTTQFWSSLFTEPYSEKIRTPNIPRPDMKVQLQGDRALEPKVRDGLIAWLNRMLVGKPFIESQENSCYSKRLLMNLNISQCYNCKGISIWVHDQLIWPPTKLNIPPNQDLPAHIVALFDEAREIVAPSPRGAAALLRLSVQHLCVELGESGKNIDYDIASLVSKGLNPLVQQALDVVRVIGNEAVHPGEIDLNDNRDTALQLFDLVNMIAEQMISQPKRVQLLYDKLPQSKLEGIEQRNRKVLGNKKHN